MVMEKRVNNNQIMRAMKRKITTSIPMETVTMVNTILRDNVLHRTQDKDIMDTALMDMDIMDSVLPRDSKNPDKNRRVNVLPRDSRTKDKAMMNRDRKAHSKLDQLHELSTSVSMSASRAFRPIA